MDRRIGILLVSILMILMVASSGCLRQPKEQSLPATAAFAGGTQGLDADLLQDQPPAIVFSDQPFQIAVKVENKGEGLMRDVNTLPPTPAEQGTPGEVYGYVSISGVDPGRFGLAEVQELRDFLPPVQKVGTERIQGGQTQVIFPAKAPQITGAAASFPLQVVVLYTYVSEAVAGVCLKENLYQQTLSGTEICKLTGPKPVESSGAPIKVTEVDELPTGFNMRIRNVGDGSPFAFKVGGTFPQTEGSIDRFTQKDRVRVSSVRLGDTELNCNIPEDSNFGGKQVFVINNEASFFCPATLGVGKEFVEQLTVTLEYGYINKVSRNIEVQSIG
jgi:hypothetical protein